MSPAKRSEQIKKNKKAIVTGTKIRSQKMPMLVGIAIALILAVGVGAYVGIHPLGGKKTPATTATSPTAANGNEIRYALSEFSDGQARYYSYDHQGRTIRYFILKSSDGVVRAAFDACDVCWPAGRGYAQQGDDMVCRNCGRRFASVLVNEVQGGCNPAPLIRTVKGNELVVNVSDILSGQRYFNFKDKV